MDSILDWIKILVSPVVTFIAFFFTYRASQKASAEQKRISLLPLISIYDPGDQTENRMIYVRPKNCDSDNIKKSGKTIQIQNLGKATAVDSELHIFIKQNEPEIFKLGHIGVKEIVELDFEFLYEQRNYEHKLDFVFHDLAGKKYVQHLKMYYVYEKDEFGMSTVSISFDVPSYPDPI